ncbi:helix-turn-helix domain-containing protein [Citrobacter portucalensis]|uniref:helix-turn-helix domain-containing protein n=1 Tax=Citrobacter portucalensis TaxID=1639133 RepID=UPI0039767E38
MPPAFAAPSINERKKLIVILKAAGLTLTTSRIHLLHYLTGTTIPITAFDLSKLVDVPLSTTHRNLSTLSDFRLVDFIVDRSGVARWYLVTAHCASYCPTCNQTFNAVY